MGKFQETLKFVVAKNGIEKEETECGEGWGETRMVSKCWVAAAGAQNANATISLVNEAIHDIPELINGQKVTTFQTSQGCCHTGMETWCSGSGGKN
jgi:hypothetical protein